MVFLASFRTRFGEMTLIWERLERGPAVLRIDLPGQTGGSRGKPIDSENGIKHATDPDIDDFIDRIRAFCDGSPIRFSLDRVRLDRCSPFQRRVLIAEHAIPRGEVRSYGRLAHDLGDPHAARAVGTALATNPFPIVVPCHRAIRSDGSLGGYQGGVAMKRALLEMEGVRFDSRGRVLKPRAPDRSAQSPLPV